LQIKHKVTAAAAAAAAGAVTATAEEAPGPKRARNEPSADVLFGQPKQASMMSSEDFFFADRPAQALAPAAPRVEQQGLEGEKDEVVEGEDEVMEEQEDGAGPTADLTLVEEGEEEIIVEEDDEE
jgi:hypothetical protein